MEKIYKVKPRHSLIIKYSDISDRVVNCRMFIDKSKYENKFNSTYMYSEYGIEGEDDYVNFYEYYYRWKFRTLEKILKEDDGERKLYGMQIDCQIKMQNLTQDAYDKLISLYEDDGWEINRVS